MSSGDASKPFFSSLRFLNVCIIYWVVAIQFQPLEDPKERFAVFKNQVFSDLCINAVVALVYWVLTDQILHLKSCIRRLHQTDENNTNRTHTSRTVQIPVLVIGFNVSSGGV